MARRHAHILSGGFLYLCPSVTQDLTSVKRRAWCPQLAWLCQELRLHCDWLKQKGEFLKRQHSRRSLGDWNSRLEMGDLKSDLWRTVEQEERLCGFWLPGCCKNLQDVKYENERVLCDPMPGSSVHGILQVRMLEWVAISFSRVSSQPKYRTCDSCIPCIDRWVLYYCTTWETNIYIER